MPAVCDRLTRLRANEWAQRKFYGRQLLVEASRWMERSGCAALVACQVATEGSEVDNAGSAGGGLDCFWLVQSMGLRRVAWLALGPVLPRLAAAPVGGSASHNA